MYTHIYRYRYIFICVCVRACVGLEAFTKAAGKLRYQRQSQAYSQLLLL